jgi:hypothetical protein
MRNVGVSNFPSNVFFFTLIPASNYDKTLLTTLEHLYYYYTLSLS